MIVQPETVLRWHRDLFRSVWRRKSWPRRRGKPPLTDDLISLIRQMAKDNLTWGAERIRGELLKLGLRVSKSTVQKCTSMQYANRDCPNRRGPPFCATMLVRSGPVISSKRTISSSEPCLCS
mgnify:CR=1 FL=1